MFIEASSTEPNEDRDHLVRDPCQSKTFTANRHQCTCWLDISVHVGAVAITPTSVVRDLGVLLLSELSMRQHIGKLTRLCYYHLRRLKKIRHILGPTITCRLVFAFASSRLDYCNSILAGLPKSTIAHLQRVQNAAVRLVCGVGQGDHVTKSLRELHWLPIRVQVVPEDEQRLHRM